MVQAVQTVMAVAWARATTQAPGWPWPSPSSRFRALRLPELLPVAWGQV